MPPGRPLNSVSDRPAVVPGSIAEPGDTIVCSASRHYGRGASGRMPGASWSQPYRCDLSMHGRASAQCTHKTQSFWSQSVSRVSHLGIRPSLTIGPRCLVFATRQFVNRRDGPAGGRLRHQGFSRQHGSDRGARDGPAHRAPHHCVRFPEGTPHGASLASDEHIRYCSTRTQPTRGIDRLPSVR